MPLRFSIALLFTLAAGAASPGQQPPTAPPSRVPPSFDRSRDASADIHAALAEAQRSGRRVLLDIGGDWCAYCLQFDALFRNNPALLLERERSFVTVHIFYSDDQRNARALAGLPPILGIPHLYVLDETGALLHSQHAVELREAGDYSPTRMKTFLQIWASAARVEPALSSALPASH